MGQASATGRRVRTGTAAPAILAAALLLGAAAAPRPEEGAGAPRRAFPGATGDVTEASFRAAERGLAYLAAHQNPDGSWDGDAGFKLNQDYKVTRYNIHHVGVTALAGIAFLSGGHLPERGPYADTIARCIDYVLSCVREQGYITAHGTRMYSHAFATLFLAEVYGMTHRSDVGRKLQQAVDLIVQCQNRYGSWRYEPFAPESDMSVTVCQLMALRAARNIGIKVPRSTIDRAVDYVRRSYVDRGSDALNPMNRMLLPERYYSIEEGCFLYQIFPDGSAGYKRSSYCLTAAGVVSLYNAGRYSDAQLQKSLAYLERNFDLVSGSKWRNHYFYWYGHYYAVQAMYIAGGRWWEHYYPRIRKQLVESQRPPGNWENFVGPGSNFATAVAVIVLQVPFDYLPIFIR